jgi:phytanoyl-CoA hydroxylase
MEKLEWLEVRQGTLIVFNGLFPHLSEPNRSAQSRHAYTLHAVDGHAHYPDSNWIQPQGMPFTGFA